MRKTHLYIQEKKDGVIHIKNESICGNHASDDNLTGNFDMIDCEECMSSDEYKQLMQEKSYNQYGGFGVYKRNPNHWDISSRATGRMFCIRGDVGDFYIRDERNRHVNKGNKDGFKTLDSCMAYICAELMLETYQ